MSNTSLAALSILLGMVAIGQEKQGGAISNSVRFAVSTAKISTVTPSRALPGTAVTVSGVGFGEVQGNGQVWLGGAMATAQTWSDSQIVALVASGAASGQARVLQNGVFSNGVPFTVSTPHIASVSPGSAGSGTLVTISGIGFGTSQDSGTITLGSTAGQVVSWSDEQVIAAVAPNSLTGIVRIQQDGYFSNAISFTVPVINDNGAMVRLNPTLISMEVGDSRSIQGLNSSLRPVTGLVWTSSDPTVVGLSSTDPPVLTALTPGHATIIAGGASTDVTVSAISATGVGLRPGTIIWSNPGDGSGVNFIESAYPSTSGVADIFAIMGDGEVLAIDSDGLTAWSADGSMAQDIIPNFQGGLVQVNCNNSIVTLDGTTGRVVSTFRVSSGQSLQTLGIHPDGQIFASVRDGSGRYSIVGIDPTLGNAKFSLPLPGCRSGVNCRIVAGPMVAGDEYAYVAYQSNSAETGNLMLLRIDGNGKTDLIRIKDFSSFNTGNVDLTVNLITNADKGVVLIWQGQYQETFESTRAAHRAKFPFSGMAVTNGTSVDLVDAPTVPNQRGVAVPILQADDGSFLGTFHDTQGVQSMIAFDASGNLKWVVPNETPQIATNDGGVISASGIKYDVNGNATGQAPLYLESWTYNMYRGGESIDRYEGFPISLASGWAFKRWSSAPSRCPIK